MRRQSASLLLILPLLYLGACALANRGASAQGQDGSRASEAAPVPQDSAVAEEAGAQIAVLLPLRSASIGRQADAVRLGILEAAKVHRATTLPLVIHATSDEPFDVVNAYESAVRGGAQIVIGPLTRSAVTSLAGTNLISVPTLALNAPDVDAILPPNLFVFGLQVENEAKQVAQLARQQGRRGAIVVGAESALSRRLAQAFSDEFMRRGGIVREQFEYTNDSPSLMKLRDSIAGGIGDVIFLALDDHRAKNIRSYLGKNVPIFATSLVHTSAEQLANFELNGVYFVDMPWLLTPDHPAVLSYARQEQAGLEFQRFYALGIDAYRIAQDLLKPLGGRISIDGVTGGITLERDHRFIRESLPAQFNQGQTRVLPQKPARAPPALPLASSPAAQQAAEPLAPL